MTTEPQLSTVSIRADFIRPGGRYVRHGNDRFEIFPRTGDRFAWAPLTGCLTFTALAIIDGNYESGVTLLVGLWVAIATVFGVWTVSTIAARRRPVARFDRRCGLLTYWAPSDTLSFPLESIVAVQTLRFCPQRDDGDNTSEEGSTARAPDTWEVNVVVGGAHAKRLCVACGGADERTPARALAEFLGAPLYSHLAYSGSAYIQTTAADSLEPAPLTAATLSSLATTGQRPAPPTLRLIS